MRITKIKHHTGSAKVLDCYVDNGYYKAHHGSLPDVDIDYPSNRRQDVKEYLERRYNLRGKQRVFSAGAYTTMKARSVIKDVARTHKLQVGTTNYITAIIEDDSSWTDIMLTAFQNQKVYDFVQKNWEVFEEIQTLMNQTRTATVHASALVITPDYVGGDDVECFDILPIRKADGMLISELSGTEIDEIGLLKNDVLGIAELERLSDMIDICNSKYGANISIETIINSDLNDDKVYEPIRKGLTQGIFQLSGNGMTRYIKEMQPTGIEDLIASVALFRPGTLDSGAAQAYVDCKRGDAVPEYLWGTYDILKNTFAQIVYQEQVSSIARKIGNLSLGDGVNLVKALSKKKIEKVRKFKDKYFDGAKENMVPQDQAESVWSAVEDAASYLFNRSHAVEYGLTGFIGAWIKAYYPIAFYTVLLKWADKSNLPIIMNEMRELGGCQIVNPDINISSGNFETDYQTNTIYWSLSRIRQLGPKAVNYIVFDREKNGKYDSMNHFIERIFKYKLKKYQYWDDPDNPNEFEKCPVNARCVKNLILSGAFDKIEGVGSIMERYGLLHKAANKLGFELSEKEVPENMVDKHYFWAQQQINIAGIGVVDYKRIWNNSEKVEGFSPKGRKYMSLSQISKITDFSKSVFVGVCATISEVSDKTYKGKSDGKTKHFGKITLLQNTDVMEVVIWSEAWADVKDKFKGHADEIVLFSAQVKWDDYNQRNMLQINKGATVQNIT